MAHVPTLWLYEVISVMAESRRRGHLSTERAYAFLDDLRSLPIEIDAVSSKELVLSDAYRLATKHGLSGYDAIYLVLALRKKLPLASLDRDLNQAAEAEGVTLVAPEIIDS
jgi:predicted nucleic acid-binding protein